MADSPGAPIVPRAPPSPVPIVAGLFDSRPFSWPFRRTTRVSATMADSPGAPIVPRAPPSPAPIVAGRFDSVPFCRPFRRTTRVSATMADSPGAPLVPPEPRYPAPHGPPRYGGDEFSCMPIAVPVRPPPRPVMRRVWPRVPPQGIKDTPAATIFSRIVVPRISSVGKASGRQSSFTQPGYQASTRGLDIGNNPQVAHVNLMIYLLHTRDSYEPDFWADIVKWQMALHKQHSWKLLQDYKAAMQNNIFDRGNRELILSALEKAVQRVNALEAPEKATFEDAFVLRNIYDDPDLKAVIESRFSPEQQLRLSKTMDEILLHQPAFPPQCYSLLGHGVSDNDIGTTNAVNSVRKTGLA